MTTEIRGRDDSWRVYYPNEERLASPFPVYDREGVYKETLYCGSMNGQPMTESHFVGSEHEAVEYARYLVPGCEVTVVRTLSKAESLARARKARHV